MSKAGVETVLRMFIAPKSLTVLPPHRQPMSEASLALFNCFSQFLAAAYVNSKLYVRSMRQTKTIQDVVRDLDVGSAISNIIETTCQLLHCDRATLFMVDPTGRVRLFVSLMPQPHV